MALFKDNTNYTVVYRQHEFNTEALDGKLSKILDTSKCVALNQIPNKQWSYDVTPIYIGYSDTVWEMYGKMVTEKPNEPLPFISIVLAEDLDEYIELNSFNLTSHIVETPTVKMSKPFINIKPPKKTVFGPPKVPVTLDEIASEYGVKLVRDSEAPTYRYKSPNLR